MEIYTVDATNKKLGRIATEVAIVLRGKNRPDFTPNRVPNVSVRIENASKVDLTGRMQEEYKRYSGYPGGQKTETKEHAIETKGYAHVFTQAIRGMLPNNKLRQEMLKRIEVVE